MSARLPVLLLLACLGGCAFLFGTPEPPPPPPPPPEPPRNLIREIRTAAENDPSTVEVLALEAPSVTHLIDEALAAEQARKYLDARRAVAVANELEPDNPRVLQFLAEYALRAKDWAEAERLAMRAYEGSAQLGALCIRNLLTVAEARLAMGREAEAETAREKAQQCAQKPLPRF